MYHLDTSDVNIVKSLSEKITGSSLLAFSMTELIPSSDGEFNLNYYDTLLKYAGKKYLARIPALGDSVLSYGHFQMTPLAFYDPNPQSHEYAKKVGASRVNHALPRERMLPAYVEELVDYHDHTKAAYLLSVHNLLSLVVAIRANFSEKNHSGVADQLLQELETLSATDIAEYIATAHHRPASALPSMARYLRERMRFKKELSDNAKLPKPKELVAPTYKECCDKRITLYVEKTHNNLKAIEKRHAIPIHDHE
jgi:hypothetical protein